MSDWFDGQLADSIATLDAGVSVNAEDRPHGAGEVGVLKTSAVSGGRFLQGQNKTVVERERRLVAESVQGDSILVSRMNTPALVGESCYVREPFPSLFLPDRIWQLKPKDRAKISMRWLSFVLQSASYRRHVEIHATGTSGSMKNLPKSKLLAFPVSYPAPHEQAEIANILDTLDSAILETEAIIAKLEAVKQGLLHDLLTRGIDANGELRPLQTEAPRLYRESPLGWIPKEWETTDLGSVTAWASGGTPNRDVVANWIGDVPFLTPKDMKVLELDVTSQHVSLRAATSSSRLMPPETVFIVVRGMILAHSFPVAIASRAMAFNQDIKAVSPTARMSAKFLARGFVANSDQFLRKVTESTHGTKKLDTGSLLGMLVSLPVVQEQDGIVLRQAAIDQQCEEETLSLSKLRTVRSGLVDDLLTGRVRVTPLLVAGHNEGSA